MSINRLVQVTLLISPSETTSAAAGFNPIKERERWGVKNLLGFPKRLHQFVTCERTAPVWTVGTGEGCSHLPGHRVQSELGFYLHPEQSKSALEARARWFQRSIPAFSGDWEGGAGARNDTEKISFKQLKTCCSSMINFMFTGWMRKLLVGALLFHTWHEQWEYLFCPGGLHLPLI